MDRIIIVDSTRSGKRFPDALSKTIPIWCAVINRAVVLRYPEILSEGWDTALYTSRASVSPTEHAQIEQRIEDWSKKLSVCQPT
jgi:tRNA A64-2'-O-ribosylphosphate transferase